MPVSIEEYQSLLSANKLLKNQNDNLVQQLNEGQAELSRISERLDAVSKTVEGLDTETASVSWPGILTSGIPTSFTIAQMNELAAFVTEENAGLCDRIDRFIDRLATVATDK